MYHHGDTSMIHFSSVQSLRCVRLFVTPWTATDRASLSIINSHEQVWKGKKMIHIEAMNYLVHLKLLNALSLPLSASSISPLPVFPHISNNGERQKRPTPRHSLGSHCSTVGLKKTHANNGSSPFCLHGQLDSDFCYSPSLCLHCHHPSSHLFPLLPRLMQQLLNCLLAYLQSPFQWNQLSVD